MKNDALMQKPSPTDQKNSRKLADYCDYWLHKDLDAIIRTMKERLASHTFMVMSYHGKQFVIKYLSLFFKHSTYFIKLGMNSMRTVCSVIVLWFDGIQTWIRNLQSILKISWNISLLTLDLYKHKYQINCKCFEFRDGLTK